MTGNLRLPSPERTVRRGVSVCRRMGLGETAALETIMSVCQAVYLHNYDHQDSGLVWVEQVAEAARQRLREIGGYV